MTGAPPAGRKELTGGAAPRVVTTKRDLDTARAGLTGPVAVVMTMGALHAGHRSLLELARESAGSVIATVFVNPLQFGPTEDFDRYPRDLCADLELIGDLADLVFAPSVDEMYSEGAPLVRVSAGAMAEHYEGRARPGHFDGVLTVVLKLLNLTRPDLAVFGEKDAQQVALVRRLVGDFDVATRIVEAPLVRASDGLALSSRNNYLSDPERRRALALSKLVVDVHRAAELGASVAELEALLKDRYEAAASFLAWEYCDLLDPATFAPVPDDFVGTARLVLAARVGATRLLDTAALRVRGPSAPAAPRDGGHRESTTLEE